MLISVLAIGTIVGLTNLGSVVNTTVALPGLGIITGAGSANGALPNAPIAGPSAPAPELTLVFGWNGQVDTGAGMSGVFKPDPPPAPTSGGGGFRPVLGTGVPGAIITGGKLPSPIAAPIPPPATVTPVTPQPIGGPGTGFISIPAAPVATPVLPGAGAGSQFQPPGGTTSPIFSVGGGSSGVEVGGGLAGAGGV
jgi:hypothetical protein